MDNVSVEGIPELLKKLEALGGSALAIRKDAVREMDSLATIMKRKAPEDTKQLKPSIQVHDESTDTELVVKCGVFAGETSNYAIFQEYGTGIYAENGDGRKTPWLWTVKSQKWADIFGIEVGQAVIWHGNRPHPFIRPAWDESKDKVYENLITALKNQIRVISSG